MFFNQWQSCNCFGWIHSVYQQMCRPSGKEAPGAPGSPNDDFLWAWIGGLSQVKMGSMHVFSIKNLKKQFHRSPLIMTYSEMTSHQTPPILSNIGFQVTILVVPNLICVYGGNGTKRPAGEFLSCWSFLRLNCVVSHILTYFSQGT
jgi:hypothetical protein